MKLADYIKVETTDTDGHFVRTLDGKISPEIETDKLVPVLKARVKAIVASVIARKEAGDDGFQDERGGGYTSEIFDPQSLKTIFNMVSEIEVDNVAELLLLAADLSTIIAKSTERITEISQMEVEKHARSRAIEELATKNQDVNKIAEFFAMLQGARE